MDRQKIIIVGILAVLVAALIIVAVRPEKEKVNPHAKLEQEVATYAAQVDSMNVVMMELNNRVNVVSAQKDSGQAANKVLAVALRNIKSELTEYQDMYKKERALRRKLQTELAQAKAKNVEKDQKIDQMKAEMARQSTEIIDQTARIKRLQASIEDLREQKQEAIETVSKVFAYTGTRDELKNAGYLEVKDQAIIGNSYKLIGFPDEMDNRVIKTPVGSGFIVNGMIDFLADRDGKLKKGKEYELEDDDHSVKLTFTESMRRGHRILVVLKN